MPPNNGILLNGVLKLKLLNNPFASCSFINLDFLLPHTAHFDNNIDLPFLFSKTFQPTFCVFFCFLNNMSICFTMTGIQII